jgi:hypothetical protein
MHNEIETTRNGLSLETDSDPRFPEVAYSLG